MAQQPNTNPNPGKQVSRLREIGDVRRVELQQIAPAGYDKINKTTPYDKNHPYIYSEGINGDNHGKEPSQSPATVFNTGGADDIKARVGNSPGTLTQNAYSPNKEYKVDWNS